MVKLAQLVLREQNMPCRSNRMTVTDKTRQDREDMLDNCSIQTAAVTQNSLDLSTDRLDETTAALNQQLSTLLHH